jgi:hypothetical protein
MPVFDIQCFPLCRDFKILSLLFQPFLGWHLISHFQAFGISSCFLDKKIHSLVLMGRGCNGMQSLTTQPTQRKPTVPDAVLNDTTDPKKTNGAICSP